jgi:hypothetical protein
MSSSEVREAPELRMLGTRQSGPKIDAQESSELLLLSSSVVVSLLSLEDEVDDESEELSDR